MHTIMKKEKCLSIQGLSPQGKMFPYLDLIQRYLRDFVSVYRRIVINTVANEIRRINKEVSEHAFKIKYVCLMNSGIFEYILRPKHVME